MKKSKYELPWIEKYRPQTLDEIIDHTEKIITLRSLISNNELTHLIFYGPPGCGKCLGYGTGVKMYDLSIKPVQDIQIGEQLMGDDGHPRMVLSTCSGHANMYQIQPTEEHTSWRSWSCNGPHILCLHNLITHTIIEISMDDYLCQTPAWKEQHLLYQVIPTGLQLSHFTVHPLGPESYYGFEITGNGRFLLGDGTVTHNTSMILACAREMYGDQFNRYILELNASDDRGIETVRKKIPDFVKSSSNKIRLVILDEVDAMTNDAQSALRRVIEKYSSSSRFCLICNNINKIIPGLQSRCTKMRFGYLNTGEISRKLSTITESEGVHILPEAMDRLVSLNKDFRQILNTLQCLHIIKLNGGPQYSPIQPDDINEYLGIPTEKNMTDLLQILFGRNLQEACRTISDRFKNNQWNLADLIHTLAEYVVKSHLTPNRKYFLIEKLSDIEIKVSHSNDAEIQLYTLVSAFQQSLLIS